MPPVRGAATTGHSNPIGCAISEEYLMGFSDLSELALAFFKQAFQGPTTALDQGLKTKI
jgi:hypothetical protein